MNASHQQHSLNQRDTNWNWIGMRGKIALHFDESSEEKEGDARKEHADEKAGNESGQIRTQRH